MKKSKATVDANEMTLVDHLAELRWRIMAIIATIILGFFLGFYLSPHIMTYLLLLPGDLVYLYPGEAFFVHLKIALLFAITLGFPVILYQVIRFILPGLRQKEARFLFIGLPFAMLLFIGGIVFAYSFILPLAYKFFMGFGTNNLTPLISISSYVSFVLGLILPFGIVFQLPLIVLLLTGIGLLTPAILTRYRKFVILFIFIIATLLTPPDVISQVLMAVPMIFLYEFSIILSKIVFRKRSA